MRYHLTVKGSRDIAILAAKRRGFLVDSAKNTESMVAGDTCQLRVQHSDAVAPYSWYGEPPRMAPFPEGSLLHFVCMD